eukprot:2866196-Prymnesium_polylepis.1
MPLPSSWLLRYVPLTLVSCAAQNARASHDGAKPVRDCVPGCGAPAASTRRPRDARSSCAGTRGSCCSQGTRPCTGPCGQP